MTNSGQSDKEATFHMYLHVNPFCFNLARHYRVVMRKPQPQILKIVCLLFWRERACNLLSRLAHEPFDDTRVRVCLQFVICEEQRQWELEWGMSWGWHTHPFWYIHTAWQPFVSQIQMWPANKGSSVLCNLRPKADFLNCHFLCVFLLNMRTLASHVKLCPTQAKAPQRALTFSHHHGGVLAVYSGKWTPSDWSLAGVRGEIWFCPPLISCEESWRKNKRWAARNNVVLSCAQLIALILMLQACHVLRAAWMEQIVRFSEISFHILIM